MQFEKLAQQLLPGVGVGRVFGNAFNRAHHHALWLVEMPHALGALAGVYFINFFTHADRAVRALGLAHVAIDALIGDDQSHMFTLLVDHLRRGQPQLLVQPMFNRRKHKLADIAAQ